MRGNFSIVLPVTFRDGVKFRARYQGIPKPPHAWRCYAINFDQKIVTTQAYEVIIKTRVMHFEIFQSTRTQKYKTPIYQGISGF